MEKFKGTYLSPARKARLEARKKTLKRVRLMPPEQIEAKRTSQLRSPKD